MKRKIPGHSITIKPLSAYRAELYLTVDEFASLIGVSIDTFYRIQRGDRPRVTTIRRIASNLGVKPTAIAEFLHKEEPHK